MAKNIYFERLTITFLQYFFFFFFFDLHSAILRFLTQRNDVTAEIRGEEKPGVGWSLLFRGLESFKRKITTRHFLKRWGQANVNKSMASFWALLPLTSSSTQQGRRRDGSEKQCIGNEAQRWHVDKWPQRGGSFLNPFLTGVITMALDRGRGDWKLSD